MHTHMYTLNIYISIYLSIYIYILYIHIHAHVHTYIYGALCMKWWPWKSTGCPQCPSDSWHHCWGVIESTCCRDEQSARVLLPEARVSQSLTAQRTHRLMQRVMWVAHDACSIFFIPVDGSRGVFLTKSTIEKGTEGTIRGQHLQKLYRW